MAYVVGSACVGCKDTACVDACPVDCFHEGPFTLVIDPDVCIDCGLCEPECPTDAIFSDLSVPAGQEPFLEINERLSQHYVNVTQSHHSMASESPYTLAEAIQLLTAEMERLS